MLLPNLQECPIHTSQCFLILDKLKLIFLTWRYLLNKLIMHSGYAGRQQKSLGLKVQHAIEFCQVVKGQCSYILIHADITGIRLHGVHFIHVTVGIAI